MKSHPNHSWKKTFFLIWIGQAFSLFGSELVQFSLVWFLTKETGSASVLAMASFVALLPKVILSPFIGALIDRWNRQRVMVFADCSIAFFTMVLAGIYFLGQAQIWHVYVLLFLRSLGSSFHWPAMQSSTSLLVPKEQLARVSGLNQSLRGILGIVSPVAAALLLDILPMHGILALDVVTAIIAVAPLIFVVIPQPKKRGNSILSGPKGLWQDVREGFRYLVSWRGMFLLAAAGMLLNFLLNPGFTFTPLLITEHFQRGAVDLSLVEAVFSLGMIAGGLFLGTWGGFKRKIVTTLSGILGLAVSTGMIAVAKPDQFMLMIGGMALSGFMMPITNGPLYAIMQASVEPQIQGRIFTLLESMFTAMMPISMLVAAPVAEWIGVRGWLIFGALGCLAVGLAGFCTPELMNLEQEKRTKKLEAEKELKQA